MSMDPGEKEGRGNCDAERGKVNDLEMVKICFQKGH